MYLAHGLLCRFIVHSDVCNSHCYMCNSHLPLSIDMSSLSLTHPKVSSADAQRKNVKKHGAFTPIAPLWYHCQSRTDTKTPKEPSLWTTSTTNGIYEHKSCAPCIALSQTRWASRLKKRRYLLLIGRNYF